jgi:hypothetical protein
VFDTTHTDINETLTDFNNIHNKINFTIEKEQNNQINFLDITIKRKHNKFQFGIYRKNTTTDTMIHKESCHPIEHKMSGINYLINRVYTYPLTKQNHHTEIQVINQLLEANGYNELKAEEILRKKKGRTPKEVNKPKQEKMGKIHILWKRH